MEYRTNIRKLVRLFDQYKPWGNTHGYSDVLLSIYEEGISIEWISGTLPEASTLFNVLLRDKDVKIRCLQAASKKRKKPAKSWVRTGASGCETWAIAEPKNGYRSLFEEQLSGSYYWTAKVHISCAGKVSDMCGMSGYRDYPEVPLIQWRDFLDLMLAIGGYEGYIASGSHTYLEAIGEMFDDVEHVTRRGGYYSIWKRRWSHPYEEKLGYKYLPFRSDRHLGDYTFM